MSRPITVVRRYLQAIMITPRPVAGPARPSSTKLINLLPQRSCMWNEPTVEDLARIPRLYSGQDQEWQDHVIYEHFFLGGCDWYVGEYGPEERIFFGYAILNDDLDNSEAPSSERSAFRGLS